MLPPLEQVRHVRSPTAAIVLAVDDEAFVLELIQAALEDGGYAVRATTSSTEAVAILESDRARDLQGLITDVNLRGPLTGWDIARLARELNPALPIVYVTGDSGHEWAAKGVPHSVIVTKPFAPAQIVVALASLANQSDL